MFAVASLVSPRNSARFILEVCDRVVSDHPAVSNASCLFPSSRYPLNELNVVDPRMLCVLFGYSLLGERMSKLSSSQADAMTRRLKVELKSHQSSSAEDIRSVVTAIYECLVFARLTLAGADVKFVKAGEKRMPDLEVTSHRCLIDCKHLSTTAHHRSVTTFIERVTNTLVDAQSQFRNHPLATDYCHIVCLDLPHADAGIVQHIGLGAHSDILNAVMQLPIKCIFTESRLFENLRSDQPQKPRRPAEIWHQDPLVMGARSDPRFAELLLDVHLSLNQNPIPDCMFPTIWLNAFRNALPPHRQGDLDMNVALARMAKSMAKRGVPFDPHALPPLACFPSRDRDGNFSQIVELP